MELIRLEEITKTYHLGELDVPVLKGVSLAIARGEMVALMGQSGSGKSTLMNILGCLDRPTTGKYWLDDEEVSNLTRDQRAVIRNRKIGFVFQSFNLLSRTSALDNVMMPLAYTATNLSGRDARKRAEALLERVGLADRMDHHPVAAVRRPAAARGHRPRTGQPACRSCSPTSRPATSTRAPAARCCELFQAAERPRTTSPSSW